MGPSRTLQVEIQQSPRVTHPLIYEAHIGMSAQEPGIADFDWFREKVLPRIARLGYNTIQLMAIQEHPYYGSFGYQVSNFLPSAPASAHRKVLKG